MPVSSFEVAMQTVGSVLSHYRKDKNGVPKDPKDGLNQLVKEQFPHCKKKEIRPGVYKIKIPLPGSRLEMPMSSDRAFGEEGLAALMRSLDEIEFGPINFDDELDQLVEEQFPHSEKENKPSAVSGADSLLEMLLFVCVWYELCVFGFSRNTVFGSTCWKAGMEA
ncbi:UNVERIFIED_CONTAM: hypothetical protein K2H54_022123 [Gekko kuhli]